MSKGSKGEFHETTVAADLCHSCNGACCRRATVVELTDNERDFLIEGGAKIANTGLPTRSQAEVRIRKQLGVLANIVDSVMWSAPENPRYILLEDCPYLDSQDGSFSACTVYDNPRKPAICSTFPAGSNQCRAMRDARYLHIQER